MATAEPPMACNKVIREKQNTHLLFLQWNNCKERNKQRQPEQSSRTYNRIFANITQDYAFHGKPYKGITLESCSLPYALCFSFVLCWLGPNCACVRHHGEERMPHRNECTGIAKAGSWNQCASAQSGLSQHGTKGADEASGMLELSIK